MFLKRCAKCKQWRAKSEFSKDKSRKDELCICCKQCQKIYRESHREKAIKYRHKYLKTHRKKLNDYHREYQRKHKDKQRRYSSIRRKLGYNLLNKWKEGYATHHINDNDVVFIPKEIHQKFTGNEHTTIKQHRDKILNYYGSIERMIDNNPIIKEA